MKVTKHYEDDHIVLYIQEAELSTCLTLDSDQQIRRLGECLTDIHRTGGRTVEIKPKGGQ